MSDLLNKASLVVIPSGYKEDTVYSVVPSDGSGDLSFTRASNGTRVNSAGLVEVCPWNLLQYSEDLSNAIWSKSYISIVSNDTTAPNGTLTADKIVFNNSGSQRYQIQQNLTTNTTLPMTFTFYAKKNQIDVFVGVIGGASGMSYEVQFNLTNVTATEVYNSSGINTAKSIESVGDGWYKCTITAGSSSGNITGVNIFKDTTGNGTDSFYVWGAQLNIGSTAKPYFPTTDRLNVPRLTYQNGGGGCPSLLLEKQSTNDFIQSENLFTTHLVQNLTTSGNVDVATSPDGTQNADKFVPNSTSGVHGIANGSSLAITSGQTYSFSAFVKSDGGAFNLISLTFDSTTAWGATKNCIFNASTGASYSVPSGATMSSQNMGNGWYRITATLTASGSVSASLYQYRIYIADSSGNLSYAASSGNTAGIYVWGAQLEASSYPTSYIPTTSSSATRVADACSKTGISSLIGQSAGTLFVEFTPQSNENTEVVELSASTALDNLVTIACGNGLVYGLVFVNTNSRFQPEISATIVNTRIKVALSYKNNDFAFYINGQKVAQSTNSYSPSASLVNIKLNEAFLFGKQSVKYGEIIIFPAKLTDAEAIALTTL